MQSSTNLPLQTKDFLSSATATTTLPQPHHAAIPAVALRPCNLANQLPA